MCGRYSLSTPAQLVQEAFDADRAPALDDPRLQPRWNIAPTQEAPVVRLGADGGRRLDLMRWGLVAGRTDRAAGHINARAETAATLPAFRDGFHFRRCLIPADGFYEWRREGRARQPFHIRFQDRRLFAFAGLWSPRAAPGGDDAGSFTIVTCGPNTVVEPLHDRMPVILPPDAWPAWLAADTDATTLGALLVPVADAGLEAVAVDAWVNQADHEGERCVRPVDLAALPRQLQLL